MTKITIELHDDYADVITFTAIGLKDERTNISTDCERIEGDMTIKQIKLYDGDKEEIWFDVIKESDTDG